MVKSIKCVWHIATTLIWGVVLPVVTFFTTPFEESTKIVVSIVMWVLCLLFLVKSVIKHDLIDRFISRDDDEDDWFPFLFAAWPFFGVGCFAYIVYYVANLGWCDISILGRDGYVVDMLEDKKFALYSLHFAINTISFNSLDFFLDSFVVMRFKSFYFKIVYYINYMIYSLFLISYLKRMFIEYNKKF